MRGGDEHGRDRHRQPHHGEAGRTGEVEGDPERLPQAVVVHEERHQAPEHPGRGGGDREIACEAPPSEQEDRDHQQADRPQRRQLVEDQEQRAGAGGDRLEEPDDRFLGGGGVVRVDDERDEEQRRDHCARGITRSSAGRALGALTRRDLAEVVQHRPDRAHRTPCHARHETHAFCGMVAQGLRVT